MREYCWDSKLSKYTTDAILDRIAYDSYLIEIQYIDEKHYRYMREVYGIEENN